MNEQAKEARREYAREYRARNRERLRAYDRAYYAAHREKRRVQQMEYWQRKGKTGNDQPAEDSIARSGTTSVI